MSDVGAELAGAFLARCAARALTPDPRLRLLAHVREGTVASSDELDRPLGVVHERLVSGDERRGRGAWYTPAWLAQHLVSLTVERPCVVADPACGGGVFLLAAADRLHDLGADPTSVVGEFLWGADVDPVAVAVSEAELWLWSADRGAPAVAGDRLVVGDSLLTVHIPAAAHIVVGNPPFLGQLKKGTSVDARRRAELVDRWGDAVQPYTDASWLFLLAGVEAVAAAGTGGMVALVQPQSVLGARDASAIRARIDETATLVDCWTDDGSTFDASVHVCAPVLRIGAPPPTEPNDWLGTLSTTAGTPRVVIPTGAGTFGDRATVVAGFRDEYYGLVDAVTEGGAGRRLVTSGAIDPFRLRHEPVRFAKRRWTNPAVDVAATIGRAARWVEVQAAPKLVVASQTKVIEAVVDDDGSLVAGVPALVVVPRDEADLWRLAAAIHAPAASAWMLLRTIGTGLSAGSCRPTSSLVAQLPLPSDECAWDEAERRARDLAAGGDDWEEFAIAADAAYGIDDPGLRDWWLGRLPLR